MHQLTDKQLVEAYREAIKLNLEQEFIDQLIHEIDLRFSFKSTTRKQEKGSGIYLLISNK